MNVTVLLVEDEPHIVESLGFALERAGVDVTAVHDGETALERLKRAPCDVVVLDVMLPRQNGFEVLKRIKSDASLGNVAVLMLTAKGQAHDRRLAEAIGADAFMTKPFSNREVVEQVKRLASRPSPLPTPRGKEGG